MSTAEQPWTIRRLLEWTTKRLSPLAGKSAQVEASVLLAHALDCRRIDLYTRYDEVPVDEARARFRDLVRRRVEGCPVAYLVGHKEFYSLDFEVTPAVLIPRDDTGWLVEDCLRLARDLPSPAILDVGTGSGCIAITVAQRLKTAQVTATDISSEALAVAARNAGRHKVADRVRFLPGDLFAALSEGERFDFVLSNPPYITSAVIETLAPEVKDYEPRLALDGGPEGFSVIDRLLADVDTRLKPGGYLLVEIGADQESAARARFSALPGYELAPTLRDGAGLPRVLRARRPPLPA
jgi:release factor glutamine methyltransferase